MIRKFSLNSVLIKLLNFSVCFRILQVQKMANDAVNISVPVKFEVKSPPRGTTDYDPKALSSDQQRELNIYKLNVRKENVIYLAEHPEVYNFKENKIKAVVSWVVRMTIIHHPRNIIEFVAKLFTRPKRQIKEEIKRIFNESEIECNPIPYFDYEEWDY